MGTPSSPWVYSAQDYAGNIISVTAVFDEDTLDLITVTLYRDISCVYRNMYFGTGIFGLPDYTVQQFYVPPGQVIIGTGILAGLGFLTVTDLVSGQVTAGP